MSFLAGVIASGRAKAFNPASLFAGGVDGLFLDPSVTSSVWQDTSATTPAGNGDPIGRLSDLSGNGNHATQSTATKRPIYTIGSGLYSSEGDATDDVLATTAGGGPTSAFMLVMAARLDSMPGNRYLVYNKASGNNGFVLFSDAAGRIQLQCWYSAGSIVITSAFASIVATQPFVVTAWYDGSASHIQIDSQAAINSSAFTLNPGTAALYIGAAQALGAQPIDGGIYGMIYVKDAIVSDANREACKAYLAARAGVTL